MPETLTTRADIEARIRILTAKRDRLPAHWVDKRAKVSDEIDALVADWLACDG